MKLTRTFALAAGMTLLFSACSKDADEAAVKENTNPLLAYVPADTIYAFATLEPVPADISDAYAQRFQPVLDALSERIGRFEAGYAAGEHEGDLQARFTKAVLDELGGELSTESLERLGISMQAQKAVYAMGVFPVFRYELTDAQALRDAIARVGDKMGYQIPEKELDGTAYWSVAEADAPVGVYIAILDGQLAFSVFPTSAEDSMLPALLGQRMPANSLADSNALAILNSQKGYTAYGSGFLDLQKLAGELLDPLSVTNVHLAAHMDFDPSALDAACAAEFKSIAAKAPRMTLGTTELTANQVGVRYELELESPLAAGLAGLVSDVPAADDSGNLFSASLALKVGKLRSFLLEKANAVSAAPYQCAQLQALNRQAADLATQLNIPMPPMVNNLLGLRVRVDELGPEKDARQAKGLAALYVDQPEMFTGMAAMMVPGIAELDLANQSDPVRVPAEVLRMDDAVVYALTGKQAIGLSLGEGYADRLEDFLDDKAKQDGTFFSISYDIAAQLELGDAIAGKFAVDADHHGTDHGDLGEAFRTSYAAMLDRSHMEMRFTPSGLVIDSQVSFK